MTPPLVRTDEVTTDILGYIAERNLPAADRIEQAVHHVAERIPDHPYVAEAVEVLAVLHARQLYP